MNREQWRHLRARLLARLLPFIAFFFSRLPWGLCQRLGRALGALVWPFSPRDRRRTLQHLAIAFPERTARERSALGRASFRHHGTTVLECLHLLGHDSAYALDLIEIRGWEHVETVRAAHRPLMILTGHCGNWELLAPAISGRGVPLSVVARQLDDSRLDELVVEMRSHFGTQSVGRGTPGAARQLLRILRESEALALLVDQDIEAEGCWVPFFGRLAHTPLGPAHLALRRRAVVIPTFDERLPSGRHRVTFHPPLELDPDPVRATAQMSLVIEEQIRRRPEQWVWMHRRWRRRPPEETDA